MTAQHIPTLPGPADPGARDPGAWVTPALVTALMAALGPAAVMFGGLSAMATDSCGPDHCSQALETSLAWIYGLLSYGSALSLGALITAWVLPWKLRFAATRICLALVALLPPLAVLLLVFSLPAP
jgi:hypothetical protein